MSACGGAAPREQSPLLPRKDGGEAANAAKLVIFVGSIFMCGCVGSTLIVFTGDKIAKDPAGFSESQVSYCQMLFWVGWATASATLMPSVDSLGRKVPCYSLLGIAVLAGIISTRTQQVWLYGAMLFVVGFTLPPSGQIGYLLMQESVPERLRAATTVGVNVGFSLVLILMALQCGYVTRAWSWRLETMAWYAPMLLICLVGPLFVSESPVFAAQGQGSPSKRLATAEAAGAAEASGSQQLFGAGMRATMFYTCICWTSASVSFYGLSYSAGSLSPNVYMNVILFALTDIVGYAIPAPIVGAMGSKNAQIAGFSGTALSLLLCAMLPQGSWMAVACALVGRLHIDVAFSTVFLLIVDCFPSSCRAAALGVANVSSRSLTFAAPLCAKAPAYLSCSVLSALCFAAVGATWALDVQSGDRPAVPASPSQAVAGPARAGKASGAAVSV